MSVKLPKKYNWFCCKLWSKRIYRVKYDEGILLDLKMLVDQNV